MVTLNLMKYLGSLVLKRHWFTLRAFHFLLTWGGNFNISMKVNAHVHVAFLLGHFLNGCNILSGTFKSHTWQFVSISLWALTLQEFTWCQTAQRNPSSLSVLTLNHTPFQLNLKEIGRVHDHWACVLYFSIALLLIKSLFIYLSCTPTCCPHSPITTCRGQILDIQAHQKIKSQLI